jgi:hypothetical protein
MTSVIVVNAGSASLNVSVLGDGDDVRPPALLIAS